MPVIKDAEGKKINIGNVVRITGCPKLSRMNKKGQRECLPIFQYLVGKYKKVSGFDQYHCLEIWFNIRDGKYKGRHWVAIEPNLVKVKSKK